MAPVEAVRDFPIAANVTLYETIEFAVPIDATGAAGLPDPTNATWRLSVFIGLRDFEHFMEVNAVASEWHGGGGTDAEYDPDYYDAFLPPTHDGPRPLQETAFNVSPWVIPPDSYPVISAYKDIQMNQIFIPEFPLPFGFALIAIVVLAASFKLRKKLYL